MTLLREFYRHNQAGDRKLDGLHDRIEEWTRQVDVNPAVAARLIEGVELETGFENLIEHGLEKEDVRWQVVDLVTYAVIYRNAATTANKTKFLSLVTSAAATVDILVF